MLRARLATHESLGVCFPDMSTLTIAATNEPFRQLLQRRMILFKDGAGLA